MTAPTPSGKKLRVVVVDDSSICRASIACILQAEGDIEVVAEGEDGFSALPLVEEHAPDLVTMDVQMPGKSGLEAITQIMARHPVPILVVTAEPLDIDAGVAFVAIENGALDIVAKPAITDPVAGAEMRDLVRKLAVTPVFHTVDDTTPTRMPAPLTAPLELITVIAGPGGMPSVLRLLSCLPCGLRVPLVLHQPVSHDVIAAYVKHVAQIAKQPVTLVESGLRLGASQIALVLGKRATCPERGKLVVDDGPPCGSTLLQSVARAYGASAAGVILAGRGADGADGLRALRARGAPTLAESPLSASVPEMPLRAIAEELVDVSMRVDDLAERIYAMSVAS